MVEILIDVFRFLHFLGLAALLGGLLVQMGSSMREVNAPILHGAITQLVTGVALLLLTLADANHLKVTVKLVLLIAILVIVLVRRQKPLNAIHFGAVLGLTVVNVGLAVFW